MRIPRLFSESPLIQGDEVSLSERNHHYVSRVLRGRIGQPLCLMDGAGRTAEATVVAISKGHTQVQVTQPMQQPDLRLPVTLGLALIKPDRFDWALQKATELGVTAITPLLTAYTDSPPPAARLEKKMGHWREILINACEQSGNPWVPELNAPKALSTLSIEPNTQVLAAHPGGGRLEANPQQSSWLLIGPEGGFSDAEQRLFAENQVKLVSLGPRILRAETAATVGLTLLGRAYGQL